MYPIRFGQKMLKAGGIAGSVFNLIAATVGSGTICFPYAVMMNGYVLGPLIIFGAAWFSFYSGMLQVKCAVKTKQESYEGIARELYGKWAS